MGADRESILADWLARIADADDSEPLLREFGAMHPDWVDELRQLVALDRGARGLGAAAVSNDGPRLQAGQCLGSFSVIRRVAVGGMGEVYEAEQIGLGRRVALKVIRRGHASESSRRRFQREQVVLAKLHQNHIVPIYASGEEENLQYFAMPFIDGCTLHVLLNDLRAGRLTPRTQAGTLSDLVRSRPLTDGDGNVARLSTAYYRSAAEALAATAEAIDNVHRAGVIHRDLKPSNLMVDRQGSIWVIDFGLAGVQTDSVAAESLKLPVNDDLGFSHGELGTAAYMAPEQHEGRAEPRSDVWGLGCVLYELLALAPAFSGATRDEIRTRVLHEEPRALPTDVPADLAAVVRMALKKEPASRYASPGELGADLRRWLRDYPTVAGGTRPLRTAALWCKRNWMWFAPLMAAVVAALGLMASEWRSSVRREREAVQREQEQKREAILLSLQSMRLTNRDAGWTQAADRLVREAAQIRAEGVQPHAAAILAGFDARLVARIDTVEHPELAFDGDGGRLLVSGLTNDRNGWWSGSISELPARGIGPVAVNQRGDAIQLQLPAQGRRNVELRNLGGGEVLAVIRSPRGAEPMPTALAIASSGKTIAASFATKAAGLVVVCDVATGRELITFPFRATALALTPDGSLLAAGDETGRITVRPTDGGAAYEFGRGRSAIHVLAFGRLASSGSIAWRLAVGEAGGAAAIWNLATRNLEMVCTGSAYDLFALDFSADGMTLATAGRDHVRLWDVSTGRQLLRLLGGSLMSSVRLSPDGKRLAVGVRSAFGLAGHVSIWDVESDRGLRELRGLAGNTGKLVFSPDESLVAALSHDWRIAVWELPSGRLLRLFDSSIGTTSDNAALAFDERGARLAVAGGREAKLWELSTGSVLRAWNLPPGFGDSIAFRQDKLLSLRGELRDGSDFPYGRLDPASHPRVFRMRDLLSPNFPNPIWENADSNAHVFTSLISGDGATAVLEGRRGIGSREKQTYFLAVVSSDDGKPRWTPPKLPIESGGGFHVRMDAAGELLSYSEDSRGANQLADLRTGTRIGATKIEMFGARAQYGIATVNDGSGAFTIVRANGTPMLRLDLGLQSGVAAFSPKGRFLAFVADNGALLLADLRQIQAKLNSQNLGW